MGVWDKLTGRFKPDPRPVEIPAGMKKPESLESMMRRTVRTQMSEIASRHGAETFEESCDFDIDGEGDPADTLTDHQVMAQEIEENEDVGEARRRTEAAALRRQRDAEDAAGEDASGNGDDGELRRGSSRDRHGVERGEPGRAGNGGRQRRRRGEGREDDESGDR